MPAAEQAADPVARLGDAAADYRDAQAAVAEYGADRLDAVADAHRRAHGLLDQYESDATGSGDFQAYVTFRDEFSSLVEDLPDDLPARDAFEAAGDAVDKRRLSERDFDAARDALSPAGDLVALLDDRDDARDAYRDARAAVRDALADARDHIDHLESVRSFADADLDAPVDDLRDPIEVYNAAVRDAFTEFKRSASARDVLAFVAETRDYPLVAFRQPPDRLREYVETAAAGTEPVPTLLEYADYSRSKLGHYVDDPVALKRAVGTARTYLDRLDAEPLTVSWPPPAAGQFRWRARELVGVVDKFAGDDALARLHDLRALARGDQYRRLRRAAVARDRLDADERSRLESGVVEDELVETRERVERLEDAITEYEVE
jgi:hypothetical protein